jgi:hypothetical protein
MHNIIAPHRSVKCAYPAIEENLRLGVEKRKNWAWGKGRKVIKPREPSELDKLLFSHE